MKKSYAVGDATKASILNAFRKSFYEKGIRSTSYSEICSVLGINKGLIAYHFSSKYAIAKIIYDRAEADSLALVRQTMPALSAAHSSMTNLYLFHLLLRENRSYLRFCYEIMSMPEYDTDGIKEQIQFMEQFMQEAPAVPDEKRLETINTISNGIEREVIRNLYSGYLTDSVENIFRIDAGFTYSQLGFSQQDTEEMFQTVFRTEYRLQMTENFKIRIAKISEL